jgi:hypothetical protein
VVTQQIAREQDRQEPLTPGDTKERGLARQVGELERQHQSASAYIAHEFRVLGLQPLEPPPQVKALGTDLVHDPTAFARQYVEHPLRDEAGEFIFAERRRVQDAEVVVQDVRPDERCADLDEAPTESLAQYDVFRFVQSEGRVLDRKETPGAAATSLDFVNNQGQAERLVMFGDPTQCRSRHRVDAALALDGFQQAREHTRDRRGLEHDLALAHDRPQENAHASVYDFTQPLRLERVDEFRLNGRQPLESVAKAVVVRDAEGGRRLPVERAQKGDRHRVLLKRLELLQVVRV